MSKVNILHLTDVHFGQSAMSGLWPSVRSTMFDDLRAMLAKTGAIDLIVLTGDIANRALKSEYELAGSFLEELGAVFLAHAEVMPQLAVVPGNHDVDRSVAGKLAKKALWEGWNEATASDFFADEGDEVRSYARSLFATYDEWVTSSLAISHIPLSAIGVLPGDYSATVDIRGQKIGVLGLNSSYRHINNEAAPGKLSVTPPQIQAAAGGDLQAWSQNITFGLVLTHHPFSWLANEHDVNDSIFGGTSRIKAHLCGHLHTEKYSLQNASGERGRVTHQGQSMFGLENFGVEAKESREHGYAILSFETDPEAGELGVTVWPRKAARDREGVWFIDRDASFGLKRDADSSRSLNLPLTAVNRMPGASSEGVDKKLESSPPVLKGTHSPGAAAPVAITEPPASLVRHISAGSLAVVVGDQFVGAADNQSLAFASFRNALWRELGSSEDIDPSHSTELLMDQVAKQKGNLCQELVSDYLGNPSGVQVRRARLLADGPWSSLIALSPLRDIDQAFSRESGSDGPSGQLIDGTNSRYALPSAGSNTAYIRLASAAPANGTNKLRLPVESGASQGTYVGDWIRYSKVAATASPVLFLADSVSTLGVWNWLTERAIDNGKYRLEAYLVCPALAPHQIRVLADLGVVWISTTVAQFVDKYLVSSRQEIARGKAARQRLLQTERHGRSLNVRDLVQHAPAGSKEYLLGRAPTWGDVAEGFAASLSTHKHVHDSVMSSHHKAHIVVGTAGCGRTTLLMQMALRLSVGSHKVAWIDASSNTSIPSLISLVEEGDYDYVFVDDVDSFGQPAARMLDQLQGEGPAASRRCVVAGVRSVREDVLELEYPHNRVEVGNLRGGDFDALVRLLRENRAVANKRASDSDIRELLQGTAQGQLLVGMIQATSGMPFGAKIASECGQLGLDQLNIYGGAAIVAAEREAMTERQLLETSPAMPQPAWKAVQSLRRSGLLTEGQGSDRLAVRHRVVALEVRSYIQKNGLLPDIFGRVLRMYASAAVHISNNADPDRRTFIRLLNHTYIISLGMSVPQVRAIYDSVEATLEYDFHYWLQRGAFEVEQGDISYALHNLQSAMTTDGGERHFKVLTEFAMLRFKVASTSADPDSVPLGLAAFDDLLIVIAEHGLSTPHSIAVLAKQGVPWLVSAPIARSQKLPLIERALVLLKVGSRLVTTNSEIAAVLPKALSDLEILRKDAKSGV